MTTHDRGCSPAFESLVSRPARTALAALLGLGPGVWLGVGLASTGCGQVTLPGEGGDAGPVTSDAMQPGPDDPRLVSSFEISAVLTYMGSFPLPPEFLPAQHDFVLLLGDTRPTAQIVAGVAGEAVTGSFTQLPGGELSLDGALSLSSPENDTFGCGYGQVGYQSMTLTTFDDDGDGRPDRVEGTATGSVGGFIGGNEFTATVRGIRDTTPPRLALLGSSVNRSVLSDVVVQASEPLRPGLGVTAVSPLGARVPLAPVPDNGSSIVSFVSPEDVLLPFDGTIRLEVSPAIEDLAGNRGTLETATFETIADPGDFPQDGFESQSSVTLSGGAELVAGVGSATAIAGTTSLLLEPGSSATLRIPLQAAGAGPLTLQLRGLFPDVEDRAVGGEVVIISPGAPAPVHVPFPAAVGETVATGNDRWAFAGAVTRVDVALPASAAGELIVVLRIPAPSCTQSVPNAAVLIDDVLLQSAVAASTPAR